jgi:3-deoxy-D-manno-octulosonic-acid transferase
VPHGGQNPLEPAKLGCALVFGPHMFNFRAIVEELAAARAADTVRDAIGLSDVVGGLLADPASLRARGAAANAIAAGKGGIVDDVLAELAPILPSDAATSEDAAAPRMGIRGKHARA